MSKNVLMINRVKPPINRAQPLKNCSKPPINGAQPSKNESKPLKNRT
nr:hypothetical protein [uncultured Allobacillus sp.]